MSFHIPEKNRIRTGPMRSNFTAGNNGAFAIESPVPGRTMFIVAADGADWKAENLPGEAWEHVSVHIDCNGKKFTPTWNEMCEVKRIFWDPEDAVVQFHPAKSEYVNVHPFVLHLWRPTVTVLPMPPRGTI